MAVRRCAKKTDSNDVQEKATLVQKTEQLEESAQKQDSHLDRSNDGVDRMLGSSRPACGARGARRGIGNSHTDDWP